MSLQLSAAQRLAMFTAWNEKCAWCLTPVFYNEFEVEHVIPKQLLGDDVERSQVLRLHGLPLDFDLHGLPNLVPSCGPCNRGKGKRPPLAAPAIALLLERARERASGIEKQAEAYVRRNDLDRAVDLILKAAAQDKLTPEVLVKLKVAGETITAAVAAVSGRAIVNVHPALAGLIDRDRWTHVKPLSDTVAFVADGKRGGAIGTHISWQCDWCGSNGPWNGNVCQTCFHRSEPDW